MQQLGKTLVENKNISKSYFQTGITIMEFSLHLQTFGESSLW